MEKKEFVLPEMVVIALSSDEVLTSSANGINEVGLLGNSDLDWGE